MRNFRWRLVWCLILIPFLLSGGIARALLQEVAQPEKLLAVADDLVPAVARLRHLEPKAPIQKGIKTRAEISQFITREVSDHYEKNELKSEGALLQKLGLIPPDMDYAGFILKLLTEQVGGFYDPEKKAYFIAGWLPIEEQKPAMVHELTHALQDQYFDLKGMQQRDRKSHNEDLALAHQAIAEGDATAVMLDFILEPAGMTYLQIPNLVSSMSSQLSLVNDPFEVLRSAPDYIRETLVFPYSYGTAFMQKVRAHGEPWSVVDKIYSDLPVSTEQIIHPDKYLGRRDNPKPVSVEDPTSQLGKDWKVTYRNVLGEFSLYLLLKLNLPEESARNAADGWGGDQVILVEENAGSHGAVFAESVWDDQQSADRFYGALSTWLANRYPKGQRVGESESGFGMVSNGEYSSIRRRGPKVRLIVGLPESYADKFANR
ncbi:MAG: hypothetical protein LAP85_18700 [Acidobacteriia bacterium]|nr:hypothetical protein [Terriglobia bacterium]